MVVKLGSGGSEWSRLFLFLRVFLYWGCMPIFGASRVAKSRLPTDSQPPPGEGGSFFYLLWTNHNTVLFAAKATLKAALAFYRGEAKSTRQTRSRFYIFNQCTSVRQYC